ncbi:uncharacterized protein NPIL_462001 [Nephila pilipes]|uniref:Uncharacterized protein n=1 Tax=Nephila pilipes TaxID=299642 RepID=A0A8X6QB63_NEPPI|nr:uncharacterized protein NPIL_462001 [Nephila pilipes]
MDVRFWPPLKLLACARVGRGILYTFDWDTLARSSGDYIQQIEDKISTFLLSAVETFTQLQSESTNSTDQNNQMSLSKIKKLLLGMTMILRSEIVNWFCCHRFTLSWSRNFIVRNTLSWYSYGIINRFETARGLIQNERLNIMLRFTFAYKYYFEEDVQRIWTNMSERDRHSVRIIGKYSISIRYWLNALEHRSALDWTDISLNIKEEEFFVGNCFGIRYYFTKLLSRDIRYKCILSCLEHDCLHAFDLYCCLSELNADELNQMFTRLPQDILCKVFQSFLHWPFQIIFLEVINRFQTHITEDIYFALIRELIDKVSEPWQDYAYEDILKYLWNVLSPKYSPGVVRYLKKVNGIVRICAN